MTDDSGRFTVETVRPGRYANEVTADGFLVARTESRVPQDVDVVVVLPPELTIEGVVQYSDGRPVEAAVIGSEEQAGNRFVSNPIEQHTLSAADGRFKIPRLAPGQYSIHVEPPSNTANVPARSA